jgi:hypothetical protein
MKTMLRIFFVLYLAALVVATGFVGGCNVGVGNAQVVRGSGNASSEPREVSGFSQVRLDGTGDVTLEQSGTESLSVEADDNILPLLETTVRNGVLHLAIKSNVNLQPARPIRYHVTVKQLTGLGISGSGSVHATGIDAGDLEAEISGSGSATLAGRADNVELRVSGSGSYHAAGLKCKTVRVSISGSGGATVNASDRLEANVSGSGSVHYAGDPAVTKHISGSGSVTRR